MQSNIKPGGYLELSDIVFPVQCDDGSMTEATPLRRWADLMLEGSKGISRRIDSALFYREQFEAAGFQGVVESRSKWPSNKWPKDPKFKELGE